MLHVYICAKSGLKNLFANLNFCTEFSTPYIKTTRVGYCLTTMEVALKLLCEEKDLIDMKDKKTSKSKENKQKRNSLMRQSFTTERTFSLNMDAGKDLV